MDRDACSVNRFHDSRRIPACIHRPCGTRGNAYLILSGILCAVLIYGNSMYFVPGMYEYTYEIIDTMIVSVLMDATELFVFLDMIVAAIRLRKLTAGKVS